MIAEGATEVKGSSGVNGTVDNATVDVLRERLVAGKADLSFDGGTRLEADTMSYDGKSKMWIFSNATLMFNTTPGATEYEALKHGDGEPAMRRASRLAAVDAGAICRTGAGAGEPRQGDGGRRSPSTRRSRRQRSAAMSSSCVPTSPVWADEVNVQYVAGRHVGDQIADGAGACAPQDL